MSLPLQRCVGELGCTEMEWEELNPKLKRVAVWRDRQVMRGASTALAGGDTFSGLSVVQAQVIAMSAHPSFPSHL